MGFRFLTIAVVEDNTTCSVCARSIEAGAGYVVRIDVFADPEIPPLAPGQIASADLNATLAQVIEQTKHLTAEDLQDSVHKRFHYRLCPACHKSYLANPLGLPRKVQIGKN